MAKNIILDYIKEKLQEEVTKPIPGPVVTVSRDFGCPGEVLGNELAKVLSSQILNDGTIAEWKSVNKEIISTAAEELHISEAQVERMYKEEHSTNIFENIFSQFADYMPSDIEVKKKVATIILSLANQGKVVIVGRAGAMLTHTFANSLHIQLHAPIDWRIQSIMNLKKVDRSQAKKLIETVDRERVYLRKFFSGEENTNDFFDISFNAARLSVPDMLETCLLVLKKRGIVK